MSLSDLEKEELESGEPLAPVLSVEDLTDDAPLPEQEYRDLLRLGRDAIRAQKSARAIGKLLLTALKYGSAAARMLA